MTRRVLATVALAATGLALTHVHAPEHASATLPPDDTTGTALLRATAEAAAAEFFAAEDPSIAGVACEPPSADSPGVEMRCYGTNGSGEVVTATATVNDYGDVEMAGAGEGPAPTTPTSAASTVLATYSGEGSAARPVEPITAPTIVRVTHDGAGEFTVQPQHGGVAVGAPLLSVTGASEGRYLVGLGGTISSFAITADGAWTLELDAISTALPLAPGTPATAETPDVVSYSTSAAGPVAVEYSGTGPIVVEAVTGAGPAVVVDEPGPFSGSVTLPAGPGQLLVDAFGSWTIALSETVPTTAAPSSAAPSSAAPSTTAPASAAPSTAPTTASPSTTAPATSAP